MKIVGLGKCVCVFIRSGRNNSGSYETVYFRISGEKTRGKKRMEEKKMKKIREKVTTAKKKEATTYISAILIFICAVAISLGVFLVGVQNSIEKSSGKTLMTNVSRQSEHIRAILDIHYGYLNGIAQEMGESEELLSEENLRMLSALSEKAELERVAIIEADGTAHYDNGVEKNVSARRYFKEGMNGKETLSDPLESSVDEETRVVLGVPIWKEGKVEGVLGGSYNVTTLSRMLFNDFFDGVGYTLICTGDGEIIAYDGDPSYHKITYGDNFFEFYKGKTLLGGASLENVKEDFLSGTDGLMKMRNGNDYKSDQYLAYTTLGMNDWMICYVIPVSEAQKSYAFIQRYELIFTVGFILMVFALFLYVLHRNRTANEQLLHVAQTDGLTGVLNKKSTEGRINEILQENPNESATFVIMDVDFFKEVNDRYGHITGDRVLNEFGQQLQNHFREGDIIGRIGGDEFVVLMRKTEMREGAVARVRSLIEKMENLKFPEMNGENVTISVGISFATEYGNCYEQLYKTADAALYETKQAGRNGYHIYQGKKE